MTGDIDFVLQTLAATKQLRIDWELVYYSILEQVGHSGGATERENDALNEAQDEMQSASTRIMRLEGLYVNMMSDALAEISIESH
tara:strand:+ start:895 stop:1149 length:255 start_codon:yes stop_codon:yes gene_type:complete